jgi:excisionase family DNA binding protein
MNNQNNGERLLKITEVMERTSLSKSTIYRLMEENKLQCVKIGTAIRFKESELRRFIVSLEVLS